MKKAVTGILIALVVALGGLVMVKINYPPTEEQLAILKVINIRGLAGLWGLRIVSLCTLMMAVWLWKGIIKKWWSVVFIVISPIFLILWALHPIVVIKIFLVTGFTYGWINLIKKQEWVLFIMASILVVVLNVNLLENHPAIFNKFSLVDAQNEVTARITSEDSLLERINFPLPIRRIAYNKYYFVYKQVVAEIIPFLDFESIFFQEINPIEQKSMVIFYWPEIVLLIVGIYAIFNSKNTKENKMLIISLGLAWVNYIFSEGAPYLRLVLVLMPLSLVLADGIELLINLASKKYVLATGTAAFLGIFLVAGVGINFGDLATRVQFWFDNRPLAYQFWFENLEKLDLNQYEHIQVTSLIGKTDNYCWFYLGDKCQNQKFVFNNFDLEKQSPIPKTIYAGFAGEFVGSKFKNDISSDWLSGAKSLGLRNMATEHLRDTIANKYGNDISLEIKD